MSYAARVIYTIEGPWVEADTLEEAQDIAADAIKLPRAAAVLNTEYECKKDGTPVGPESS